jgi:hypothetical protein
VIAVIPAPLDEVDVWRQHFNINKYKLVDCTARSFGFS